MADEARPWQHILALLNLVPVHLTGSTGLSARLGVCDLLPHRFLRVVEEGRCLC